MRPTADGRDTRNARGRATVRSIEREAVRLALQHGPAALTVDHICEAVGISQRQFFNHFDTKDDALLGWELPHLSAERRQAYLDDPAVGVLTGALTLVELPTEITEEQELVHARLRVMSAAPWLAARQTARMLPIAGQVAAVVELKLRTIAGADIPEDHIRSAAALITAMAAALTLRPPMPLPGPGDTNLTATADLPAIAAPPGLPNPAATSSELENMRWIWNRLL
ncbi:TetR/AcrR family transcriptional regulator [Lacisediminihabitans changchengi]|uniref:TetR family transcriptional regulator n=1 Tax=Lacisediminihabitans changchengi TaxID=2787634 RepID=A0A934SI44_9MICO|nr:TetR/AcrR family transcriptional regulator [Lacisediminihabitans changchengi]MBK4347061.1 TetR family transcriptional regulator [Lacisediminihabitans changchengi]MBK4347816.1 TetR family transcriptional regulator [Lacisediminihabitans changchengi]